MLLSEVNGEVTGKPLISLWKHFPRDDFQVESLVRATTSFQRKFPSDIIKIPLHGRYPVVDFGCQVKQGTVDYGSTGSSTCVSCIVNTEDDWEKIRYVDPLSGHYGQQLEILQKIKQNFPNIPVMMTVFSPTMVARKLSFNKMPDHYFSKNNEAVKEALKVIEEVTIEFMNASIDYGADGIFAAIQESDRSINENEELVMDLIQLNAKFMKSCTNKAEFTVLHLHGENILFNEAIEVLQPTAVNWHDQTCDPSLAEAGKQFTGGLFGGLDPLVVLKGDLTTSINSAVNLRKDLPLILSPGCVLLQGTLDETLQLIFDNYKITT